MNLDDKIRNLAGPILVLGASGFIGANLLRRILAVRSDVTGTIFSGDTWRLNGISSANIAFLNLQDPGSVRSVLHRVEPQTIFDCSSFGAYSFEQHYERVHATNYLSFIRFMEEIAEMNLAAFVHAGSSSEYGLNSAAPAENASLVPNSHYAVSKVAASAAIAYFGKVRGVPVTNLRLYAVYGPFEDSSRLIPTLCEASLRKELPVLARAEVSRDFVHVDDVIEAFVDTAQLMGPALIGESINIGSGLSTTLATLANLAITSFGLTVEPRFNPAAGRTWDTDNWYADTTKAKNLLSWSAKISLADGLKQTRDWWQAHLVNTDFKRLTKRTQPLKEKNSISAVIACYRDVQAIPIMHKRLVTVFQRMGLDYEIIFVNDNSPDDSAEVIREISARDPHVIGINHSRNFGSQAAFRSGMEIASKEAVVLMDGDLQDPPELIEAFIERWRAGAEVVYGRRIKREMPVLLEACYRAFYRVFAMMSEVPVPKDAGDFSLIDRSVVYWLIQCRERDSFLRGLRAYVGFRQEGVDYVRPERMFGTSTNNWIKNIGWAKKGIFSFSRMPLHLLTAAGGITSLATILLAIFSILMRVLDSEAVPKGMTFLSLLVMFFGSSTLLGIGLLGEYIGKILEETKARPAFIRRSLIVRGEIRPADPRRQL
ncbi:epimerase [Pseudomonas protegens]|uniref:NAD-dependent epimerase/dehydratase family protein n=1 Tax=Pseudomonas protegens TaxID=380021 RepID=UPI000F4CE336|nr:NAD-dependent epimerase/dehydratase family protein [Pseudomonas protegens]ROL80508.1 epimerase [Pseudomonas protegens]